jgi:hypothetical protein
VVNARIVPTEVSVGGGIGLGGSVFVGIMPRSEIKGGPGRTVTVGTSVGVDVTVGVGEGVAVWLGVEVELGSKVGESVAVGLGIGEFVEVGVSLADSLTSVSGGTVGSFCAIVGVGEGVAVRLDVGVKLGSEAGEDVAVGLECGGFVEVGPSLANSPTRLGPVSDGTMSFIWIIVRAGSA